MPRRVFLSLHTYFESKRCVLTREIFVKGTDEFMAVYKSLPVKSPVKKSIDAAVDLRRISRRRLPVTQPAKDACAPVGEEPFFRQRIPFDPPALLAKVKVFLHEAALSIKDAKELAKGRAFPKARQYKRGLIYGVQ
jgi:hypothetical protein